MRKDANDPGPAFDLLVEALGGVGGAQARPVFFGKREDSQALWNVLLEPGREFRSGFAVL